MANTEGAKDKIVFGSGDVTFTNGDVQRIAAQASEDLGMRHVPTVEINPALPAEIQPSTRFLYLPADALHQLPDFLGYSSDLRQYAGTPMTQKQLVALFLRSMLHEQNMQYENFPGSQEAEALAVDEIVKGLPASKRDREISVALAREILNYVSKLKNNETLSAGRFGDLSDWRLEQHINFVNQRHPQHSPAWLAYVAALEKLAGRTWQREHPYAGKEEREMASYLLGDWKDAPRTLRRAGELHELFAGDLPDLREQIGPLDYAEFSGSSSHAKSAQAGRDIVAALFGKNWQAPQAFFDSLGAYFYVDSEEGLKWIYRLRADEEPKISIGGIPFKAEEVKLGTAPWMPGDAIGGKTGLKLPDSLLPLGRLNPWGAKKDVYAEGETPVPYLIISIDGREGWRPMNPREEDRGFYDRATVLAMKLAQDMIRKGGKVAIGGAVTSDMGEVENALMRADTRYAAQAINELARNVNGIPFVAYITSSLPDQRKELEQLRIRQPGLAAVFYEPSGRDFMERSITGRLGKRMGVYNMADTQGRYNLSATNK